MNRWLRCLGASALLLVVVVVPVRAQPETAPAWQLKTPQGETVRFPADAAGKPSVLLFWPSWCPFSRALQPYVQAIWEDYRDAGVHVWSINIRENGDPVAAMKARGLDFPLLLDGDPLMGDYGISRSPWLVVVDGSNRIVYTRPAQPPTPIDVAKEVRTVLNELLGEAAVALPESYPPPYDLHLRDRVERDELPERPEAEWQAWVEMVLTETRGKSVISDIAAGGAIRDGRDAITRARAIWDQRYVPAAVRERSPYRSFRRGGLWLVTTTGGARVAGDGFVIVMQADSGAVLHIADQRGYVPK